MPAPDTTRRITPSNLQQDIDSYNGLKAVSGYTTARVAATPEALQKAYAEMVTRQQEETTEPKEEPRPRTPAPPKTEPPKIDKTIIEVDRTPTTILSQPKLTPQESARKIPKAPPQSVVDEEARAKAKSPPEDPKLKVRPPPTQ